MTREQWIDHLVQQWKETGRLSSDLLIYAALYMNNVELVNKFDDPTHWLNERDRARQRVQIAQRVREERHSEALRAINQSNTAIERAVRDFDLLVWRTWMQSYYQKSDRRLHEARTEGMDLTLWGSAGRVLVNIQSTKPPILASESLPLVTIIAIEDGDKDAGLQSIDATEEQARSLIAKAVKHSDAIRTSITPGNG